MNQEIRVTEKPTSTRQEVSRRHELNETVSARLLSMWEASHLGPDLKLSCGGQRWILTPRECHPESPRVPPRMEDHETLREGPPRSLPGKLARPASCLPFRFWAPRRSSPRTQGLPCPTHLDHVAVLDDRPQQLPVFRLVLLLLQVRRVLCVEKGGW